MKQRMVIGFALLALWSLSALTAAAGGGTGDSPATAPYIDNATHTIDGNSDLWFRFDYSTAGATGDRPASTLTLVDGNKNNLMFEVWTTDGVSVSDGKPVGRGSAATVICGSGVPSAQGECKTNDLTWVGAFGTSGTYYVKVTNNNNTATNMLLTISGSGVSLGSPTLPAPGPTAQPTMAPAIQPAPTPATPPGILQNVDDPNRSTPIDNAPHTLTANSATWFRFDYTPTNDLGDRVSKTIRLVNGRQSGVRFEVWTPDHVNDWWDNQKPIGRGTVYMVDCDTGQCESNDLIWIGGFNTGGPYYVRVVNDNTFAAAFLLTIQ